MMATPSDSSLHGEIGGGNIYRGESWYFLLRISFRVNPCYFVGNM